MKKASIYWYSQTGNSFMCAKWARSMFDERGWATEMRPLAKLSEINRDSDLVVFCLHIINFDIPFAVKRFVKRLPKSATTTQAVAVITYHGTAANTPWILRRLLRKKNIDLVSYRLLRAENSEIPVRCMLPKSIQYNKPDQDSFKDLEQYLASDVIDRLVRVTPKLNPFSIFHWIALSSPSWAPRLMLGKRIAHHERCVNCRMCYTLCPSGALTYDDSAKVVAFQRSRCIGCCGCLNVCSKNVWETKWFSSKHFYKSKHAPEMFKAFLNG